MSNGESRLRILDLMRCQSRRPAEHRQTRAFGIQPYTKSQSRLLYSLILVYTVG